MNKKVQIKVILKGMKYSKFFASYWFHFISIVNLSLSFFFYKNESLCVWPMAAKINLWTNLFSNNSFKMLCKSQNTLLFYCHTHIENDEKKYVLRQGEERNWLGILKSNKKSLII